MRLKPVIRCCVLAGLLVLPLVSGAVGLGRLTLQSGLGQALSAEIELTSIQPGELDSLTAKLADQATYSRNRIDFPGALSRVRVVLDRSGSPAVLRLTSTQPINEPFLDLLIEINWASGRIVREYTFLLDPPGYAATAPVEPAPAIPSQSLAPPVAQSPAPVAPPAAVATAPAPTVPAVPGPPPQTRVAPAPGATPGAVSGQYGPVRRGETLAAIAAKVKPDGVTLEQMLAALYRANAQAFDGKNMNRLRTGPMLTVPKADEANAVAQPEARKEIRVQAADWRAYRERLAASIGTSEATPPPARSPSGGRITTAVDEKAGPAPGSDRLKLSKGEPVSGTVGGGAGSAAAKAETAVANQKATAEANARVAELERQLKNMQRLLELKSAPMTGQQQAAADQAKATAKGPAPGAAASAPSTAPSSTTATPPATTQTVPPMAAAPSTPTPPSAAKTEPPKSSPAKTETAKADASKTDAGKTEAAKTDASKTDASKIDAGKTDVSKADPSKAPTIAAIDPSKTSPVVSTTPPAPTPAKTATDTPSSSTSPAATGAATTTTTTKTTKSAAPADAVKPKTVLQPPAPQPEPSLLDELMSNMLLLIGLGAALLLALLWFILARRRRSATTKFEDSIGAPTDLRTSTVFGNTGGGVVNTGDNSLVSDFSREGMGNIDTGEVDPIAEAEVYLAYGRDNQAEEILRDALTKTPDRQEIRLKLLEIYAQQNKAAAFEATASELFNATQGNGETWNKAAQLGRTIDPDNPLYAAKEGQSADSGVVPTVSPGRNDRMSDSNLRVAEAVEKSAMETGFDFTDQPNKEVFVMPPALTAAEAARAASSATQPLPHSTGGQPVPQSTATPSRDSMSLGTATMAAPLAAAATASVAAAAATRASAVRDRAPLDFKLDSGPEESAEPAPSTMDFVTLDGPITLTGATTLSGPSTLSGVTLASPSSDIWGEKPLPTLAERDQSAAAARAEKPIDLKVPPLIKEPARAPMFVEEFTTASAPDTVSPMTRAGPPLAMPTRSLAPAVPSQTPAVPSQTPASAGRLDLEKLDLQFDHDRKPADDSTPSVLDGQWHDAATKLDLAKAYFEMGDVDGAREILQEVMQEGDDQQKKEAQTFLSKLRQ